MISFLTAAYIYRTAGSTAANRAAARARIISAAGTDYTSGTAVAIAVAPRTGIAVAVTIAARTGVAVAVTTWAAVAVTVAVTPRAAVAVAVTARIIPAVIIATAVSIIISAAAVYVIIPAVAVSIAAPTSAFAASPAAAKTIIPSKTKITHMINSFFYMVVLYHMWTERMGS
ncbi:MAG: hypothetical protein HFG50_01985 [Lachnospiraceae bacterium]|nr:hypothetical protein [Lachnospiraceae bacterium]